MKFSISKLKSTLGGSKSQTLDENFVASIIKDVENSPFAISDENVLYAGLNELGGYYFFQTVIVGTFHIKTVKGAQLTVMGKDFEIVLDSDMVELESDATDTSKRSVSKIDFQIEKADINKIDATRIQNMVLKSKKQVVEFSIYKA